MEYLSLTLLEKNLKIDQMQFGFRTATRGLDVITLLKETFAHYNKDHTDFHCVRVDQSKVYCRINISSLCDKLKATCLRGQIINLVEFMGKYTFFCTSYEGCLNDEWIVVNGVRQRVALLVSF